MEALECVQGRERSCEGSEHSAGGAAGGVGWVSVEKWDGVGPGDVRGLFQS